MRPFETDGPDSSKHVPGSVEGNPTADSVVGGLAGSEGGLVPTAGQPPAVLVAPPDAVSLLRGLRRRWLLAFSLSVLGSVIAATGVWLFLPPPDAVARSLLHVDATPPWVVFNKGEGQANFQSY